MFLSVFLSQEEEAEQMREWGYNISIIKHADETDLPSLPNAMIAEASQSSASASLSTSTPTPAELELEAYQAGKKKSVGFKKKKRKKPSDNARTFSAITRR